MVEYARKRMTTKDGSVRYYHVKVLKNGTSERITKEEYEKHGKKTQRMRGGATFEKFSLTKFNKIKDEYNKVLDLTSDSVYNELQTLFNKVYKPENPDRFWNLIEGIQRIFGDSEYHISNIHDEFYKDVANGDVYVLYIDTNKYSQVIEKIILQKYVLKVPKVPKV